MSEYFNQEASIVMTINMLLEVIEKTTADPRLLRLRDKCQELRHEFHLYLAEEFDDLPGRE